MQFLVRIELDGSNVRHDRLEELRRAEVARARELAAERTLLRLWRDPRRWANWGLWSAPDEAALHRALDSLPLRALMTITVHPVVPHPSDPAAAEPQPEESA